MSRKLTQDEFVKQVKNKYKNKYEVVDQYIDAKTPIKIKHRNCGTIFSRTPNSITTKSANCCCPVCDCYPNKEPLVGINDLWTTHPDIAKLLKNSEDGYRCSQGTLKKLDFLCKYCGQTVNEAVNRVVKNGRVTCRFCSTGVRYPNRFMANLLRILNVTCVPEYIIPPYTYKFDFYFIIDNHKYIVEMDGGIGHGNKTYDGQQDYKGLEADKIKDKICSDKN